MSTLEGTMMHPDIVLKNEGLMDNGVNLLKHKCACT